MSTLELTTPYYRTHELSAPPDYDAYWTDVVDPDGKRRDRTSTHERDQYLDDIKQEIQFVRGLRPNARTLLDVGCGLGWFLSGVASGLGYGRRDGGGWEKYGVEVSGFAARSARAECRAAEIHHGTLDTARCEYDYYDVVFCHHVIEHVECPEEFVSQIRKTMSPGGHLVIATPDFDSPCARRFGENYRMLHDPTHVSLFTGESMHRFLRDFGFTIDRVEYPFPERYATAETMERWKDTSKVSPPWPGNWMTFYCRKD